MLTLSISPKAEADLIDIWLYVAEDQPVNADRLLDRLNDKALSLAKTAGMGTTRPRLLKNYNAFPLGLTFYITGQECQSLSWFGFYLHPEIWKIFTGN